MMCTRWVRIGVASAALAILSRRVGEAAPAPSPLPCFGSDDRDAAKLYTAGSSVIVCFKAKGKCTRLAASGAHVAVAHPPSPPPEQPRPTIKDGGRRACLGATCRALGPTLRAAIGKQAVTVTTDVRRMLLEDPDAPRSPALWDVPGDRPIPIARPHPDEPDQPPSPATTIAIVGNQVLASFLYCAGPCNETALVDDAGQLVSPIVDGGLAFALADGRLVIVGVDSQAVATILAPTTGTQLQDLSFGTDENGAQSVVMLGGHELVVLTASASSQGGYDVVWIDAPRHALAAVVATQTIATCAP